MTSTHPDRFQALEEMLSFDRSTSATPPRYPFYGQTVDPVYQDFQDRLRPPPDSVAIEPFTFHTFAVVDADCLGAKPLECVVCTDAVAFVEGEAHEDLKLLRMPLGEGLCTAMGTVECLVVAPDEV